MPGPDINASHEARDALSSEGASRLRPRLSRRTFGLGVVGLGGVAAAGALARQLHRTAVQTFDGASSWLNSSPLAPQELTGNVVLVNFWTLTCINWLRTVAHVRAWAQAYRDDGLIDVGVHTP